MGRHPSSPPLTEVTRRRGSDQVNSHKPPPQTVPPAATGPLKLPADRLNEEYAGSECQSRPVSRERGQPDDHVNVVKAGGALPPLTAPPAKLPYRESSYDDGKWSPQSGWSWERRRERPIGEDGWEVGS